VSGDPQYGGVAETFIANFDSAAEVDFFVGDVGSLAHYFNVDIYEFPDGYEAVAYSHQVYPPAKGHVWLKFELEAPPGVKFVRGKEYIVRVTRPGGNINWYKDTTDEYSYGHMVGEHVPRLVEIGGGSHITLDSLAYFVNLGWWHGPLQCRQQRGDVPVAVYSAEALLDM
jgi:hypothetical protein